MEKSLSHLKEEAVELKEIYGCEYTAYEKWLKKGFVIVKSKDGKLIKRLNNINVNDEINIKFFKGEADAHIKKIKNT